MKLKEIVDLRNKVYLLPIGDIHLGVENVDLVKLSGYINWAKQNLAYIFLMGDLFDVATLTSKTSPFTQKYSLNEAIRIAKEIFEPMKDKIIGAITGNHELRLERKAGFNVMEGFCNLMGIEYCGYSAVLRFRIGKFTRKNREPSPRIEYIFYCHHSTGGGATIGGKLNRAEKLRYIFEGADAYIIGHNHAKGLGEINVGYLSKSGNGKARINYKRICYVDSGSFYKYDNSYAEQHMLPPSDTGCPRIRMDGVRKDLHISF